MAEYYTGRALVGMRLEINAPYSGENVVRDTIHNAMSVAWKLNVVVAIVINGCDLHISPDDSDVDAKLDALKNAWATNQPQTW